MKIKPIILTGDKHKEFIKIVAAQFRVFAEKEIELIEVMIRMDLFSPFHINKYTRAKIQKEANMTYGTLSTCLNRLTKAGVIARVNKNVYLIPAFRGLDEVEAVVFRMS